MEFVFGVAEAERWTGAALAILFGQFCWTVTARNAGNGDDGIAESHLATQGQWSPCLCSAAANDS